MTGSPLRFCFEGDIMDVVSQSIARARIFSARHAWLRWGVVVLLAATAGMATHRQLATVEAERAAWGVTMGVLVAVDDLAPGGGISVRTVDVPRAVVPSGALTSLPAGARLRQRVMEGAILTTADITAAQGPAAGAEPGSAVVPIIDPLVRDAAIGLEVQVSSEGVVLADEAEIVSISGDVVFVSVPERDAAMVAAAAQAGLASLIFLP